MRSVRWNMTIAMMLCGIASASAESPSEELSAHRARMRQLAESIQIADVDSKQPAAFVSEPVLRYSDATRANSEAALWIWGGEGRPAAIVATEYYPERATRAGWLYEICSVSRERITATHENGLDWSAKKPGISLQELPQAGVPADRPARRLSQMKQLLRRFTAHESAVLEGRVELRLMINALHRYDDANSRLIDGAIFAFANGTNPEVFVVLEAHANDGKPASWNYSLAPMTGGAVTVSLDGAEIWTCEPADPPAERESYVNGWIE